MVACQPRQPTSVRCKCKGLGNVMPHLMKTFPGIWERNVLLCGWMLKKEFLKKYVLYLLRIIEDGL